MTQIVQIKITHFKGIKNLTLDFNHEQKLFCFIGRGDSGKTSILEAISHVLSPKWKLNFHDTDFYKCDIETNLEIEATLIGIPEKLLVENKYGLFVRGFDLETNTICDDATDGDLEPALTVRFTVDRNLEPSWNIINGGEKEPKPISSADRAELRCFIVADYVDKHLTWNQGSPLYALLNSTNSGNSESKTIVIDLLREAKKKVEDADFGYLDDVTDLVREQALNIGLDLDGISTTLDFKDIAIKDSRVSLHEESIPYRQKGKGSKRLASMAIQAALAQKGGIMLVDEIEQGLEPDRIKHLTRFLNEASNGQIFITTHSRDVISELGAKPLIFLNRIIKSDELATSNFDDLSNDDLKAAVRACPEAFFARKVIVCEGSTELGICRALDYWRIRNDLPQLAIRDCAYVDGEGSTLVSRVEQISNVMITSLFCDSDDEKVNEKKDKLNAKVFDCEDGLCIEQQIVQDLPWMAFKEVMKYARENNLSSFNEKFKTIGDDIDIWNDSPDLRSAAMQIFKPKKSKKGNVEMKVSWFKAFRHGFFLGNVIFKYFDEMDEKIRLKQILQELSDWVDEGQP